MEILTTPTGPIAIIEDALPNSEEWAFIAREDALVNVLRMPGGAESLADLVPFAQHISRLAVNSSTCTDLKDLVHFPRLQYLLVGGLVTRAPVAEELTSLTHFGGDPRHMPGLVELPTILWLKITWRPQIESVVSVTTRQLELLEARSLTDLRGLGRLENLESLTVHGSRNLSLRGIDTLGLLRSLTLHTVKNADDISCLLEAPTLTSLTLEQCSNVAQPEALLSFSGKVRVIGRHPFSREFLASVGPNWVVPSTGRP